MWFVIIIFALGFSPEGMWTLWKVPGQKHISVLLCYSSSTFLSFCDLSILFLYVRNLLSALCFFAFLSFCTSFSSEFILVGIILFVVEAAWKVKRVLKILVSDSVLKVTGFNLICVSWILIAQILQCGCIISVKFGSMRYIQDKARKIFGPTSQPSFKLGSKWRWFWKEKKKSYSFDLSVLYYRYRISAFFSEDIDSFMDFQTVWDLLGSLLGILDSRPGVVYCSQMSGKTGCPLVFFCLKLIVQNYG